MNLHEGEVNTWLKCLMVAEMGRFPGTIRSPLPLTPVPPTCGVVCGLTMLGRQAANPRNAATRRGF